MDEKTTTEQKKLILVVDDSEDMRKMLTQLLERAGYRVVLAGDGQTSLTQAKQHHPDLILMDLSLPDINGWEAVELLRKMSEFRDTPIIAVTAKAMKGDRERCIEAGAWDYLAKPVDIDQMLSVLRAWLHRNNALQLHRWGHCQEQERGRHPPGQFRAIHVNQCGDNACLSGPLLVGQLRQQCLGCRRCSRQRS